MNDLTLPLLVLVDNSRSMSWTPKEMLCRLHHTTANVSSDDSEPEAVYRGLNTSRFEGA